MLELHIKRYIRKGVVRMSGGKIRSHKRCKKKDKYDPNAKICVVCGWRQRVQKNKLFKEEEEK